MLGATLASRRNVLEKWAWLENPHAAAISISEVNSVCNIFFACSTRNRVNH